MDGLNRNKLRDCFTLKENILSVGIEFKKIFKDNSLKVSINDKEYRIIGSIGLCHCVIDISKEDNIKIGDEVYLNINPLQVSDNIRREYI